MNIINKKIVLALIIALLIPLNVKGYQVNETTNGGCSLSFLPGTTNLYKIEDLQNCDGLFSFKETKKGIEFERNVENLMQKTAADTTSTKSEEDSKLLTVLSNNKYTFFVKEKWTGRLFIGVESHSFNTNHLIEFEEEYYISLRLLSEILKMNVTISNDNFSLNPLSEVTVVSNTYTVPEEEIPEPVITNPVQPNTKPICETQNITVGSECPSSMVGNPKYENCNIKCIANAASNKEIIVGRVYDIFNPSDVAEIESSYQHPKYPSSSTNWDEFVPWLKKTHPTYATYYYAMIKFVPMSGPNCTGSEISSEETFGTAMFGEKLAGENPYGRPTHEETYSRGYTCSTRNVWVSQ